MAEFTTLGGIVLQLRPVNMDAVRNLILRLGGMQAFTDPAFLTSLTPDKLNEVVQVSDALFTYLLGWGVVNSPPSDVLPELAALGVPPEQPHLARAAWLRFNVLQDATEGASLIASILKASQEQ